MSGDGRVKFGLRHVGHHPDDVEPRNQRRSEVDLCGKGHVRNRLEAARLRVRGRQHRTSGLQAGVDAGFGDGNALLFHRFVHARPVAVVHLVELVDGRKPKISQHQGTGFEGPSSVGVGVLHSRSRQSSRRSGHAGREAPARRKLGHVGEELRLGHTRVAHQQNVDVATASRPVVVLPRDPAEQLEHQGLLHVGHAVNRGRNRPREHLIDVLASGEVFDLPNFFFGDDDFLERHVLTLKRVDAEEDVEHGRVLAALSLRADEKDAVGLDAVARIELSAQVLLRDAQDALGLDAATHLFGELLQFDELGVDEAGIPFDQRKARFSCFPVAAAVDGIAQHRLNEFLLIRLIHGAEVAASGASEGRDVDAGADTRDLRGHRVDGEHLTEVLCTKVGNCARLVRGQVNDANEGVHRAVAFIHQHLLHRLLRGLEVEVGLDEEALCEIEVPALKVAVRHLDALCVGPLDGEVVQRLVEQVTQQRFPAGLEVGFVHRNHGHTSGLGESPSSGHKHFPASEPPLGFHWRMWRRARPRSCHEPRFLSPDAERHERARMALLSHDLP